MVWMHLVLLGLLFPCLMNCATAYAADSSLFRLSQLEQFSEKEKASENQFSTAIAEYGNLVLIGAPGRDDGGNASGAAYLFERGADGHWTQLQKLIANSGSPGELFGGSVAIGEDILVVGARGDAEQGSFAGAVYIFTRDAAAHWYQAHKLTASDGLAGNLFGFSLALNGETLFIGARGDEEAGNFSGAVYVFTRDVNGQWHEQQKLTASDGAAGDGFGISVAISGDVALIGARGDDDLGSVSGAAYFFAKNLDGHWEERQKVTASDGVAGDEFGYSVALDGETAVIGARFATGDEGREGAAYVFTYGSGHIGTLWNESQKLIGSTNEDNNRDNNEFGTSVALDEQTILVGAPSTDSKGNLAGAVHVFRFTPEEQDSHPWNEVQKLTGRDTSGGDKFGFAVALAQDIALVSAPFDDITVEDEDEEIADDDDDATFYSDVGSLYIFTQGELPILCTMRTDYERNTCKGTFEVTSLADLNDYMVEDFGSKENKNRYQHLIVTGDLEEAMLIIESPCKISLANGVVLSGDFIKVDGRRGVVGGDHGQLDAEDVCLVSEQGNARLGARTIVNVEALSIQAAQEVAIGEDATVDVGGALVLLSTSQTNASSAVIEKGAVVSAGSMKLEAPRRAELGADLILTVTDELSLISTGTTSGSSAGIRSGTQLRATDLTISAQRSAHIGEKASVTTSQRLHIEAGQCDISRSATITAGSRSGNCQ
jgi:hypothetical protein